MKPNYNPDESINKKSKPNDIIDNPTIMKDEEFGLGTMSSVSPNGSGNSGGDVSFCGIIVLCCGGGSASLIEEDIVL